MHGYFNTARHAIAQRARHRVAGSGPPAARRRREAAADGGSKFERGLANLGLRTESRGSWRRPGPRLGAKAGIPVTDCTDLRNDHFRHCAKAPRGSRRAVRRVMYGPEKLYRRLLSHGSRIRALVRRRRRARGGGPGRDSRACHRLSSRRLVAELPCMLILLRALLWSYHLLSS